jgi:hypothetical protein
MKYRSHCNQQLSLKILFLYIFITQRNSRNIIYGYVDKTEFTHAVLPLRCQFSLASKNNSPNMWFLKFKWLVARENFIEYKALKTLIKS